MPSLAEVQRRLRDAIVDGHDAGVGALLVGGRDPSRRLAIHRRNYETSLVAALLRKFPATVWLMGSPFVSEAVRDFVHRRPPSAPCIAEYGTEFPDFLASRPGTEHVAYLRWFAQLEWQLGHAAISIERPVPGADALRALRSEALPDVVLSLQPGLFYLEAPWPVDDLMRLYLGETAPERYALEPTEVRLEVRGARGEFRIRRLDAGMFVFRRSIALGQSLGLAAEHALDRDSSFDPGRGLSMLIAEGLPTAATLQSAEPDHERR